MKSPRLLLVLCINVYLAEGGAWQTIQYGKRDDYLKSLQDTKPARKLDKADMDGYSVQRCTP